MFLYDLSAGVDRYNEMLREAEEYRLARRFAVPNESWFSRVAKLFVRPNRQEPAPISSRPVTSVR